MANLCNFNLINDIIRKKKKTNLRIHIIFGNAYMPNMQCLYTFIVLHISLTYTHKICIDVYIYTYIYAHKSCIQIYIHKHTFPCINGCTYILSLMYAQTYDQTTHTWLYTCRHSHINIQLHIYICMYIYSCMHIHTHKQTIYAHNNIYTL